MRFLNKVKESNGKQVKIPYKKEIKKIRQEEALLIDKTQEELIALTEEVKKETDEERQKIKAYAICSIVIQRTLGLTPYDVQLSGGYALSEGNIAQMKTGEGKTITALFPAFWGYIRNLKTYIITVNEYLADRDYRQAQTVFDYLHIPIGLILKDMDIKEKQDNYAKPIVYVTNSEFAFDYLRDNIAPSKEMFMQGSFDFAIIDEADLVLIDEAKNPVIISNPSMERLPNILKAKEFVEQMTPEDYEIDEELFIPVLTEKGFDSAKEFFGFELTDNHAMYHAVRQSMMAYFKLKKDVDYIVRDGEVLIVDKFTGRVLKGRRFQQGLHQAIEAKEGVEIQPENVAVAMITYQNLFRKFAILSGMTGTGIESKEEFKDIYGVDVKVIPTNRPVQRIDNPDIMFKSKKDKYDYLVQLVKEKYEKGQPVLIGTISVQESEEVANYLDKAHIPYHLLNAKHDKEEAMIVERAGKKRAVTIATNMAGRGTDIKVSPEVEALGGLYLVGVSRNESKRIDNQLIGRSGRQGQKGESQFLTSIEDEFLVKNATNKLKKFIKKNKEYPCTKEIVTKMVDEIQDIEDSKAMQIRKFQFQMDEILDYQRDYVYSIRRSILMDGISLEKITKNIHKVSNFLIEQYTSGDWNVDELNNILKLDFLINTDIKKDGITNEDDLKNLFKKEILDIFKKAEENIEEEELNQVLRSITVQIIDKYWQTYLDELDEYKTGFAMQAMGEQDPIRLFSMDVDAMFKQLLTKAWFDLLKSLVKRIDTLLTIRTHPFFTVFPMKDNYLFQFNLPSDSKENTKKVRSVLYSEWGIIEEFHLEGNTHFTIHIQRFLQPGKYVLKNYIEDKEINRIGFKVINEMVEVITETAPTLYFRLPYEHMHKVEDKVLRITLTHLLSKSSFSFDVPIEKEWIVVEKPIQQNWLPGRYVLTVKGSQLPLYHREYVVIPSQIENQEAIIQSKTNFDKDRKEKE